MTTHFAHIGQKIKHEMQRLGLRPKDIAEHFGIKQPSVNDLFETGRLAKKHYPALTRLNNQSLEWWFDLDKVEPEPESEEDAYFVDAEDLAPQVRFSVAEPPAPYNKDVLLPSEEELLKLFRELPSSEQEKVTEDLRGKAGYFKRLFLELLAKTKS
jgi:hypothetical protein